MNREGSYTPGAREDAHPSMKAKKRAPRFSAKLNETEQDLLWHMQNGYQLGTDSLLSDPVLRRLKDDEVIWPLSANRSTTKAMEERGLISQGKSDDSLRIMWRLNKKK